MKWITRERPKVDRIACPWLIVNFIDKKAEFIYMPRERRMRGFRDRQRTQTFLSSFGFFAPH